MQVGDAQRGGFEDTFCSGQKQETQRSGHSIPDILHAHDTSSFLVWLLPGICPKGSLYLTLVLQAYEEPEGGERPKGFPEQQAKSDILRDGDQTLRSKLGSHPSHCLGERLRGEGDRERTR